MAVLRLEVVSLHAFSLGRVTLSGCGGGSSLGCIVLSDVRPFHSHSRNLSCSFLFSSSLGAIVLALNLDTSR